MSLIQKWSTLQSYGDQWYASVHTWPHADILLQLKKSSQDMQPLSLTLIHVIAHQDDHTPFEELPTDAKLNVICDNLATKELEKLERNNNTQSIIQLPACHCYLEHNGSVLNANEATALRDELPGREIKNYYKKKNNWNEETYQMINWESYEKARRRNTTKQRYITKLCCNWLPTQNRMHMTEGTSDKCTCGEIETNDHLFACSSRKEWRREMYKQLNKHLKENNTSSDIKTTILHRIRSHYDQHTPDNPFQATNQDAIGWNNLMRGWIDNTWQVDQEKHIKAKHNNDHHIYEKTKQWSILLIEFFWSQGHKLWKDRCDTLHEKTGRAETAQTRKLINHKVQALYEMATNVGYRDRHHIFATPINEKLLETVPNLTNWVASTGPAVKQAAQDHRRHTIKNTRDIRNFFNASLPYQELPLQHKPPSIHQRNQHSTHSMSATNTDSNAPT